MNKFKLFIENFLVYGLGGIISKIIPLIMVPIVTRLMPNSAYYGISDMSTTIVSFGSALAIMGMYDAMYRLFFEKEDEEYRQDICSTAVIFTFITSAIVFVVMLLLKNFIAEKFYGDSKYAHLIYITAIATLVGATNGIISAPTRMQNKRKVFLVTNTVSPIISYGISIPLLLKGYYIISLPLASMISAITMEIAFVVMNHRWFKISRFRFDYLKELLCIAVPLLPNFLIYWIFNSSDRLMITNILGVDATGIYSVGAKLGQASQLIYTAFAGGWQFFAFSTMKEKEQVKSNSLIFEYLGIISYFASVLICVFSKSIYELLFDGEYVEGFIIAPYLFLAPLLQMLFQVAANQFLVVKKTWPNLFILSLGAIINIVLNLLLIPSIGIEGAAIATLIGYIVSDFVCVIVLRKLKLMIISKKFIIASLGLCIFLVIWRKWLYVNCGIALGIAVFFILFYLWLYKNDISNFFYGVKKMR